MANRVLKLSLSAPILNTSVLYRDISRKASKAKTNMQTTRDALSIAKSQWNITELDNEEAVGNSLDNLFNYIPGLRIMNPEYGSTIYRRLYEGINEANKESIFAEILSCIDRFEPRIKVVEISDVTSLLDLDDNTIVVNILYTINGMGNRQFVKPLLYHRSI